MLVAVIACAVTLFLVATGLNSGYSKLEQLGDIIEGNFIEEYDKTEIEDAAAHAICQHRKKILQLCCHLRTQHNLPEQAF